MAQMATGFPCNLKVEATTTALLWTATDSHLPVRRGIAWIMHACVLTISSVVLEKKDLRRTYGLNRSCYVLKDHQFIIVTIEKDLGGVNATTLH